MSHRGGSGRARKLLIVGGVAGGAAAAARARRMSEDAEIVVFDRGPHVSFANCGLPYFVGEVIQDEKDLLIATPELFRKRFNIEVRLHSDVVHVDAGARQITVRDHMASTEYRESYDALLLSPGARPIRPRLPGVDLPGIFVVRTIPDSRNIRAWISDHDASRAVVIGGGFIGLEMAENLQRRGLEVTIVEAAEQVMPPIDPEMAVVFQRHLEERGVVVRLGDAVAAFDPSDEGISVLTRSGKRFPADLVLLAMGVRPETALAEAAGCALGETGGIEVDEHMRTSVAGIWAVGDAVEVHRAVSGAELVLPLAGPANRQGRIAADDILGRPARFRGVQGTSVCGAFDRVVAMTGCSEKALRRSGMTDYERVYLHPGHHVGYFPGATPIHLKLLFRRSDGLILGAQAVGEHGIARRIDVISMAIQKGGTVFDLEEAELCYAPQFGAAKDPVNLAGMIAANVMRGDLELARWDALVEPEKIDDISETGTQLIDVRSPAEFADGAIPGAVNIPLEELRRRLDEVSDDRPVWVYCQVGQRAYYATRLLIQHGKQVRNLPGGYTTYQAFDALRARATDGPYKSGRKVT